MSDNPPAESPALTAMQEVVRWLLWREFTRDLNARHEVQDLFVEFTADAADKYLNTSGLPPEEQRHRFQVASELRRLRDALLTLQLGVLGMLDFTGLLEFAEFLA